MLGIPEELFTPIFAIARMPGWSAHRLEELINANKIIRPAYKYVKDTNDTTPTVIASTASPYKFTRSVMEALGADTDGKDDFALADELSALSGVKLPQAVETIRTAPVLHNRVVDAPDMPKAVKDILGIR